MADEKLLNVKDLSAENKQDLLSYLSTIMGEIMWGAGIKRDDAKEHVKAMSLMILCSSILQGEIYDATPNYYFLTYLKTVLDKLQGKENPAETMVENVAENVSIKQ